MVNKDLGKSKMPLSAFINGKKQDQRGNINFVHLIFCLANRKTVMYHKPEVVVNTKARCKSGLFC
jgi:hypothetical protein